MIGRSLESLALAVAIGMGGTPAPAVPQIGLGTDYATRKGRRTSAAALKRAAKKRRMARARASKRSRRS